MSVLVLFVRTSHIGFNTIIPIHFRALTETNAKPAFVNRHKAHLAIDVYSVCFGLFVDGGAFNGARRPGRRHHDNLLNPAESDLSSFYISSLCPDAPYCFWKPLLFSFSVAVAECFENMS